MSYSRDRDAHTRGVNAIAAVDGATPRRRMLERAKAMQMARRDRAMAFVAQRGFNPMGAIKEDRPGEDIPPPGAPPRPPGGGGGGGGGGVTPPYRPPTRPPAPGPRRVGFPFTQPQATRDRITDHPPWVDPGPVGAGGGKGTSPEGGGAVFPLQTDTTTAPTSSPTVVGPSAAVDEGVVDALLDHSGRGLLEPDEEIVDQVSVPQAEAKKPNYLLWAGIAIAGYLLYKQNQKG